VTTPVLTRLDGWIPHTRIGAWTVGLLAAHVVAMLLFFALALTRDIPSESFFDSLELAITLLIGAAAAFAINWDVVAEAQRASVWSGLEQVIDESDVAIERVDLDGYPPDTLVEYANDVDAALLVVGTRGRGDLASLILGSTSHRAIQLAECDVLVVKGQG